MRRARPADIDAILGLQYASYPTMSKVTIWTRDQLVSHQRVFPEGQFVAELGGRLVGYCANLRLGSHDVLRQHRYSEMTAAGFFTTHDPEGDVLYGAEVMVHPEARRRGIGTSFYRQRFELVQRLGLAAYVSGGRLPGYAAHAERLSVDEYVQGALVGRWKDRTLSVQVKVGLQVVGILDDYINDPNSRNHATLLAWPNPDAPTSFGLPTPPWEARPQEPRPAASLERPMRGSAQTISDASVARTRGTGP